MAQAGLLAVAAILAGTGVAGAGEDDRRPVAIRVYNTAISSKDLGVAIGEATSAFDAAGLEVSWTDCSAGGSREVAGAAGCHRPVGSELVLRLHRRAGGDAAQVGDTRAAAGFASMGYSLVHVERPSFASVYVDVVRAVARDAGVDAMVLLGRAMAHEIGHLLLNSDRHADEGLMRARWSRVELRRRDDRAWRFSTDEAVVMRDALAARVRPAD